MFYLARRRSSNRKTVTTREHILQAAGRVFERFGFHKSSMNDIAVAARKGRRTLYTYFRSKEEIFRAVIDTEVKSLEEKLEKIAHQNIPPDEKLRAYFHARMNAIRELTIFYEALREDLINNLGIVERIREDYDKREIALIQSILDEGTATGIFSMEDSRLAAEAMVLATKGFEIAIFMGRNDFDHNRLIDPLIGLLYTGLKKES